MQKITIAIDGFLSTGKSTVAKQLAKHLGMSFLLFLILFSVSCKPTESIESTMKKVKINTLQDAISYQDFTIEMPKDWMYEFDHGSPTYSPSEISKHYYRNMTKILNLKNRYNINKSLEKIANRDYYDFVSYRDAYKFKKEVTQTKFGESYSFTFSFKLNDNIYKVNRTYFAFNNSYYCMSYRSEKMLFDKYFDEAKALMFSIKAKE